MMTYKKLFFVLFSLALILGRGTPAGAQVVPGLDTGAMFATPVQVQRPTPASGENVAMLWYRLAGQLPDFEALARTTDAYQNAVADDKLTVLDAKVKELRESFTLTVPGDQLIAEMPVVLSEYSLQNKGYLAESFQDDTFFRFSHGGQNFGVVPRALMNNQWLGIDEAAAKALDDVRKTSADHKTVVMTFFLSPRAASPKPIVLEDGLSYRMVAAEIVRMEIFADDGTLLWQQAGQTPQGLSAETLKQKDNLLNLYPGTPNATTTP